MAAKRRGLIKKVQCLLRPSHITMWGGLKIITKTPELQSKTSGMFYWLTVYILNCSIDEISFE